ncbi:hypothetical protein SUGI_0576500 [Cryptomeria japonica]|nr:hypothetical protein SUGI_0576500 [Cryptomeria japonica]
MPARDKFFDQEQEFGDLGCLFLSIGFSGIANLDFGNVLTRAEIFIVLKLAQSNSGNMNNRQGKDRMDFTSSDDLTTIPDVTSSDDLTTIPDVGYDGEDVVSPGRTKRLWKKVRVASQADSLEHLFYPQRDAQCLDALGGFLYFSLLDSVHCSKDS